MKMLHSETIHGHLSMLGHLAKTHQATSVYLKDHDEVTNT